MDQLTKEFFHNEFSGFDRKIKLADHVLANNVPIVELDLNLDISTLLPVTVCEDMIISSNIRNIHPYEHQPRMLNWGLEVLWNNGTEIGIIKDIYYKKLFDCEPCQDVVPQAVCIKETLAKLGIDTNLCWLSKFSPGGYVRPHRDISITSHALSYFLIPINNPVGYELKIYPYGTVKVKVGSMYLFNQANFTHAVYNNSTNTGYSLLGYFNPDIPVELSETILQSIITQYTII